MKRFFSFTVLMLIVCLAYTQKPSLNKAYNAFSNDEFVEAKMLIDQCINDPKLSTKAITYLYKGNIYLYLSNQEYDMKKKDEAYVIQYSDAPDQAYDAFVKAKELDKNIEAFNMLSPDQALLTLYPLLYVYGVDLLISNDFTRSISVLNKAIKCYEMGKPSFPLYGELYYYYAYALEMTKDPNAKVYYEKAIADSSSNINVFIRLIENYKLDGNQEKVKEVLFKAKNSFPNEAALYVSEVDYYMFIQDTLKAKSLLTSLPTSVYKSPDLLVNVSNFYIQMGDYLKAEEFLRRAYAFDKNNYVILYNLGVCSYYLSNKFFNESNELAYAGDMINSKTAKTSSDYYLDQAQKFFELIIEKEPNDLNVLNTLRSIYGRSKSPKYDDIVKKIESLEKK